MGHSSDPGPFHSSCRTMKNIPSRVLVIGRFPSNVPLIQDAMMSLDLLLSHQISPNPNLQSRFQAPEVQCQSPGNPEDKNGCLPIWSEGKRQAEAPARIDHDSCGFLAHSQVLLVASSVIDS